MGAILSYILSELDPAGIVVLELAATLICGHELRDASIFVEADYACIAADNSLIEYSAGELLKIAGLECLKVTGADFCGLADGVQTDTPAFAFPT
jgi:hypothetical protein